MTSTDPSAGDASGYAEKASSAESWSDYHADNAAGHADWASWYAEKGDLAGMESELSNAEWDAGSAANSAHDASTYSTWADQELAQAESAAADTGALDSSTDTDLDVGADADADVDL